MDVGFKYDTNLNRSLQRVITTLLIHNTREVTANRHHHNIGLVALIIVEPFNDASKYAYNQLAPVRLSVESRLRTGQKHIQYPLHSFVLAVTQIINHVQPR